MVESPSEGPGVVGSPSRRSRSGWQLLSKGRELSEGPHEGQGVVRRQFLEVQKWSGGHHGRLRVVRRPSQRVERPSRMARSGWETLQKGLEWSGGPLGGSGVDGRPSRRGGSGREAITEDREWLGGLPRGLGVVGRFTGRVGSGRVVITEGRKRSGDHHVGLGVVGGHH